MTDLPWERNTMTPALDMFGAVNDDPLVRAAREAQYNQANTEEEMKARTGALRPWENADSVEQEVYPRWGLQSPGERRFGPSSVRSAGNTIFERNPFTGQWGPVASAPTSGHQKQTAFERNSALYLQQIQDAEAAETPEERDRWMSLANATKAWLEKQGHFAPPPPPKPPVETSFEGVTSRPNPAYRWDTNAPPSLSFTNSSRRVTAPITNSFANPFEKGLGMGFGGTNASTSSPDGRTDGRANVTEAEYKKLKPGAKYWWNGNQLTKQ